MKIDITGVDMKVADSLQEKIEKKLEKFHRYFGDEASCQVKVQPEKNKLRVELTLKIHRDIYRAEALGDQALDALDEATDNLAGQIRKHKAKLKKRKHQNKNMEAFISALPEEDSLSEADLPKIKRRKSFPIEAMDAEEAALQMEMMEHDFHLYINPENGRVNCVYKRRDGNYGVLEPEY